MATAALASRPACNPKTSPITKATSLQFQRAPERWISCSTAGGLLATCTPCREKWDNFVCLSQVGKTSPTPPDISSSVSTTSFHVNPERVYTLFLKSSRGRSSVKCRTWSPFEHKTSQQNTEVRSRSLDLTSRQSGPWVAGLVADCRASGCKGFYLRFCRTPQCSCGRRKAHDVADVSTKS